MSRFDRLPVPEVTENPAVPILFTSPLAEQANLGYVVARIDCELLSLRAAYLVVSPGADRISLISSTCGCQVHHSLADLVLQLSRKQMVNHPQAYADTAPAPLDTPGTTKH